MSDPTHGPGGHAPAPHQRFFGLLKPERGDVLVVLLFSLVNGLLLLATPLAVDAVVNGIAFGGHQNIYLQALAILSLALLTLLLFLAVLRTAQHYVVEIIQRRLFVRLAADLAYRLPRVVASALDQTIGPELVNRFFEIITVQKASSLLLLEGINVVLAALVGLVVLGFYHPYLLAFDLVLILAIATVIFLFGRGAVRTSIHESYAKHAVAGWLEQLVLLPSLFKKHGASTLALQRANALSLLYLDARRDHFRILLRQIVGLLAVQAIASAALLILGGVLVLRGELTLGQLVASELIVGAIVASVAKFGKHLESWYDAMAATDKLSHLAELPVEPERGETPASRQQPASVELQQVTFGYDPNRPVFQNLSLRIAAGARAALVSPAGGGASTLLDLLFALRHPLQGMVALDGLDARHWNLEALREDVALVRGAEIFEGTITENIRLGRAELSLDDVRRALQSVGLLPTVLQLPQALETPLKFGGHPLSTTQRIRLVLARAIVGRPRLLLLDEILEGLDPEIVAELEAFLFDHQHPWTLVLVTRNATLAQRCDQVIHLQAPARPSPSVPPAPPTPTP